MAHLCRFEYAKYVAQAMEAAKNVSLESGREVIKQLAAKCNDIYKNLKGEQNQVDAAKVQLGALLKDIEGEALTAFKYQNYIDQWGIHYLPSIANAHLGQYCNNFKDPGVQKYGGELFNLMKDDSETIFNNLPPPKHVAYKIDEQLLNMNLDGD